MTDEDLARDLDAARARLARARAASAEVHDQDDFSDYSGTVAVELAAAMRDYYHAERAWATRELIR